MVVFELGCYVAGLHLGMGISTVTATRILKGQMAGKTGEETTLTMDTFPFLALSKVPSALCVYVSVVSLSGVILYGLLLSSTLACQVHVAVLQ